MFDSEDRFGGSSPPDPELGLFNIRMGDRTIWYAIKGQRFRRVPDGEIEMHKRGMKPRTARAFELTHRVETTNLGMDDLIPLSDGRVVDFTGTIQELEGSHYHSRQRIFRVLPGEYYLGKRMTAALGATFRPDQYSGKSVIADFFATSINDVNTTSFFFSELALALCGYPGRKENIYLYNPQKDTGKSLAVNLLQLMAGDLGVKVPTDDLARHNSDHLLKRLYRHRPARIMFADEIDDRIDLNIPILKQLTGERVLPRPFVHGADEYWVPPRCYIFDTNQLPQYCIENGDELRTRTFVIPFGTRLGPSQRVPHLLEILGTQRNLDIFFTFLLMEYL